MAIVSGNVIINKIIDGNGNVILSTQPLSDLIDRSITQITIPTNITSIGANAFQGCTGLTSIIIPSNITSIGSAAFQSCTGLTSISLPNTLTTIGSTAFTYCSKITSVTLANGFACDLRLAAATGLSADTMVGMFNALADRTGSAALTLTVGSSNLAKLSDAQKAIATSKNWTLA